MNGIPAKASEKLEALHIAAVTVTDNGKTKVLDIIQHALDNIERLKQACSEVWHHELAEEARRRAAAFARETARRVREGAPPLSPAALYHELRALLRDRVWRRSVVIFVTGAALGFACGCGAARGGGGGGGAGPHARALLAQPDQSVMLVEDAVVPCAGAAEVLVRVQAVSVCPLDRAVLRGHAAVLRALVTRSQLTVGRGFAGVVLDAGAEADLELGDEVWGALSEWSGGAAAELITVRRSRVSKRPAALGADAAAALPWAGAAAARALDQLGFREDQWKGKRVLVAGAASGEGCALVQLLAARGAHVTAAAPRAAAAALADLGAASCLELAPAAWARAEAAAAAHGPWDAVVACAGAGCPAGAPPNLAALLKATAARRLVDLRPTAPLTDRLPPPLQLVFAAGFYAWRAIRWASGRGTHTDWLEPATSLSAGLAALADRVAAGDLAPVLDKVFIPQEFESALAHACSDDAVGTTVVRFP